MVGTTMRLAITAFIYILALSHSGYARHALKATILADTNRDGKIDIKDMANKSAWTNTRGALFLPNIGDANQRCSKKYSNLTFEDYATLDDDALEGCNDANGDIQRNPKYLAPLRTLPSQGLSSNAQGFVHVSDEVAAKQVRVFFKDSDGWTFVNSNHTFTADDLRGGLKLGIDSRDVRRPSWDGRATVHFSITDGDEEAKDTVAVRVAPILTHHHLQRAERVFAVAEYGNNRAQIQYLGDLQNNTNQAGIDWNVHQFTFWPDQWPQDMFEPGYTSIPGPNGPIVLRVMIRSAQSDRISGRQVFTELRSESVGAVQFLQNGGTIDATGNLETIPPYSHNGNSYPAGRIIMGAWDQEEPLLIPFLEAQEVQIPLILDTIWLYVGHVDEFIQFLPTKSDRGWVVMADDPLAGVHLLHKASDEGYGTRRIFSRPHFDYDYDTVCVPHLTIDEQLAVKDFEAANQKAARHIQRNIEILKNATGITDDEILRVPATYRYQDSGGNHCAADNHTAAVNGKGAHKPKPLDQIESIGLKDLHRRQKQKPKDQVVAYHPATVNGVVLSDSLYLAPNPWGPVIDGKDILAEAVRAAYVKAGLEAVFQDDWASHHVAHGEIHCGSNTWRNANAPWW